MNMRFNGKCEQIQYSENKKKQKTQKKQRLKLKPGRYGNGLSRCRQTFSCDLFIVREFHKIIIN